MKRIAVLAGLVVLGAAACSDTGTNLNEDADIAALLSVQPTPGSVDVTVGATVVVTFDHPIAEGMEEYAALHQDSLTGPEVDGLWALSADQMALTFTPAQALEPATTYFIHIGGGMMDEHGNPVDLEEHGMMMGGEWATQTMMTGGVGSGMGMGMGPNGGMMGQGWAHPTNGSYGMVFTFTTAG
jgi:Bacterial Ig-like domain